MTSTVVCRVHGEQDETFVCSHLARSLETRAPVGFWCSKTEIERPDAWCSACNAMSNGGDWSEETEKLAGIRLMCGGYYDAARELNESPN